MSDNSGSDSKPHYQGTAHDAFKRTPTPPAATPTREKGQSAVRNLPQRDSVPGSVVRDL